MCCIKNDSRKGKGKHITNSVWVKTREMLVIHL